MLSGGLTEPPLAACSTAAASSGWHVGTAVTLGPPQLHLTIESIHLQPPILTRPTALPSTLPRQADWIALIASSDFFFNDSQNESMAENLRERVRYLGEKVGAGLGAGTAMRCIGAGRAWPKPGRT